MRKLWITAAVIAVTGWFCSCSCERTEANYQVVPAPQEIVMADGSEFELSNGVKIIYPEGNEAIQRNAEYLAEYLKEATGKDYQVQAGTEGKGNILLQVASVGNSPEAYQLKVNADGVVIAGASEAGVFYGIQTLRKSIPVKLGSTPYWLRLKLMIVPALTIAVHTSM